MRAAPAAGAPRTRPVADVRSPTRATPPPGTIRYWIALPLLALAIRIGGFGALLPAGIPWRKVALIGGLGFGGFGGLYTIGVAHANPITAAILSAAGPVVAALVARFGYRVPLGPGTKPAVALACAGGLLAMVDWQAGGNPLVL